MMPSNHHRSSLTIRLWVLVALWVTASHFTGVSGGDRNASLSSNGTLVVDGNTGKADTSRLMTWVLGFVFVTIICLSSMIGFFVIPPLNQTTRREKKRSERVSETPDLRHKGKVDKSSTRKATNEGIGSPSHHTTDSVPHSLLTLCTPASHVTTSGCISSSIPDPDSGLIGEPFSSFHVSYLHNGLEGLALGSLLASSIFHLIPHAFDLVGQDREHNYLFTSLLIFTGIYLFYWSEKVLLLISDYRKQRRKDARLKDRKISPRKTSISSIISSEGQNEPAIGTSSPFPPFDDTVRQESGPVLPPVHHILSSIDIPVQVSGDGSSPIRAEEPILGTRVSRQSGVRVTERVHEREDESYYCPSGRGILDDDEEEEEEDSSQERKRHLAWMVMMGDGLHNLIDGLSLGAALSDSHLTGFSIGIAILFEEIPHELGDFAILVASGMSPSRAALCNFLSASTCYVGLVIALVCGDLWTSTSNNYIFALAAGMFLYMSIFNVMTDLNDNFTTCRSVSTSSAMQMLLWQNLGILTGVYILYSLAQFDERLLLQSLRIEL